MTWSTRLSHEKAELPSLQTRYTSSVVWLALGCILLAGLLIRVLYFSELINQPDYRRPAVDAGFHDYWARALVTDKWAPPGGHRDPHIRETPFLRPPGYPYFLALVYRLTGLNQAAPRLVQMGLGLLSGLLAFAFARRWYGDVVGLALVALLNAYWVFIYFEGELHAPVLVILLLWSIAYVTAKWTERMTLFRAAAAGVLLGLAALVRPNLLLMAPTLLIWAGWIARRRGCRRQWLGTTVGLLGGMAAIIAPVTIRNYRVSGDFVLITSNAGINLYIGNNPSARGGVVTEIPGLGKFGTCFDYPALVDNLERSQGRSFSASQVSAYFAAEAWRWIREHPLDFLKVTAWKSYLFWGPKEVEHNKIIRCERAHSSVLRHLPANFWFVLGTSLLGIVLLARNLRSQTKPGDESPNKMQQRWEVSVLLVAMVLTFFISILPFFMAARYRVPIVPFLLLFSADGLCRVIQMARLPALRPTALTAGVWVLVSGVAGRPAPLSGTERSLWHFHRGLTYVRVLQYESAAEELGSAVRASPGNIEARMNLAYVLVQRRQFEQAARQLRIVLRLNPNHSEARLQLKVIEDRPADAQGRS